MRIYLRVKWYYSRDAHLPAESGKEDNKLDRVHIVGDDHELSFLRLYEGNDVVETVLGENGLLGVLSGRLVSLLLALLSVGKETSLLLLLGFGLVLVQ